MGLIGCPETSERNYHYSLHNYPEQRSSPRGVTSTTKLLYTILQRMPKYQKHGAFITGIPLNGLQYLPLESPFIKMKMNCFDCFTGTYQLLYKHIHLWYQESPIAHNVCEYLDHYHSYHSRNLVVNRIALLLCSRDLSQIAYRLSCFPSFTFPSCKC